LEKVIKNTIRDIGLYLVLCAGTFLMLRIITGHFSLEPDTGFLAVKQDYIDIKVWRAAFYIHVFTSILTFIAGFTQFSSYLLKEHKTLHRIMGKIYVVSVLFVNVPSGMILAFYANGYLSSKIAFVILDSLWFWFTLKAFIEIKRGNILAHKQFMMRSYALTFSAITLRAWKLILSGLFVISPVSLYMIDAWLGFVPNLLIVEWLIRKNKKSRKNLSFKPDVINDQEKNSSTNDCKA
jgi:uncharacterized membrane protein